ncbi:MAG: L,D-transpeptidase [Acetatifactor sp.]|nr:L,D-transpeptidase [Acetatifactor sp.]
MKKLIIWAASILCMSTLLFFNNVSDAEAAELPAEGLAIDTRPDYTVYVNRVLNCVTVVQQDADGTVIPVKAMVCSCGRQGHETPEGVFQTSDYYEWRKMVDGTYGKYAVRFNGKILFHSVPYIEPSSDTLEWEEYNALGENASLGCVRLSVEDAKWIYDNCKPGTTVVVYSDSEVAGLLEKPAAIKIPADSPYRNWDPTDIDINNPWFLAENEGIFIGTIDEFNYTDYADRYPDLMDAFGYDREALYQHYITHGIREKRTANSY